MDINVVVMSGRLGKDPDSLQVGETTKTTLRLASSRKYTSKGEKKEETTWVDVVTWGKLAEIVKEYCVKGQSVTVTGRLVLETWQDKDGGGNRSTYRVYADDVSFGEKPGKNSSGEVSSEKLEKMLSNALKLTSNGISESLAIKTVMASEE